jgi:hypothetical protein
MKKNCGGNMKIRAGFVSNSSSASFCIYGWTNTKLDMKCNDAYDLYRKLRMDYDKIVESSHPCCEMVMGVGNVHTNLYTDENEDWRDFVSDPPTEQEMAELDKIALKLNLPKPEMYSETWYDG